MSKEGGQGTDALEEAATLDEVLPWHWADGLHSLAPGTPSSQDASAVTGWFSSVSLPIKFSF